MSIYPYVYVCTHKVTGQIYIGARWANKVPAHQDLGTYYFTSSKLVNTIFDEFDWEIIFEGSKKEALQLEEDLINKHWKQPYLLNKQNGGKKFFNEGGKSTKQKGKPKSEETKQKMSEAKKGKNSTFKGKTHSEETKQKMSENHSKYWKNKTHAEETKSKMSDSHKGKSQQIITCPHCGKEGGNKTMPRWHFENCKLKQGVKNNGDHLGISK